MTSGSYSEQTVGEFVAQLAAPEPGPGGGAAAAVSCAFAAGLVEMTSSLTLGRTDHEHVQAEMKSLRERATELRRQAAWAADADALAYRRVIGLTRRQGVRQDRSMEEGSSSEQIKTALSDAADVPLSVAEFAAETAEMAAELVAHASSDLRGDAVTGALLAEASACAAARLVQINLREDPGDPRTERARTLATRAGSARLNALAFPARVSAVSAQTRTIATARGGGKPGA